MKQLESGGAYPTACYANGASLLDASGASCGAKWGKGVIQVEQKPRERHVLTTSINFMPSVYADVAYLQVILDWLNASTAGGEQYSKRAI